jgi:preprotein translocase subunit YajC
MRLLPFLLPLVMMLFLSRQQRKKLKVQKDFLNVITAGTPVMTTSGIYATVVSIDGDIATLEVAPGVHIRVAKGAIGRTIDAPIIEVPASEVESK